MNDYFDLEKAKVKVLDFATSVEILENSIEILSTFYDLCHDNYKEFWRIKGLMYDLMEEYKSVKKERKEIRELFLD